MMMHVWKINWHQHELQHGLQEVTILTGKWMGLSAPMCQKPTS